MTDTPDHKPKFYAFLRPRSGRGVGLILAVTSETAKTVTGWSVHGTLAQREGQTLIRDPDAKAWEKPRGPQKRWMRALGSMVIARFETEAQALEAYAKALAVPDVDSFRDNEAYQKADAEWKRLINVASDARIAADKQWTKIRDIQLKGVAAYRDAINQAIGVADPKPEGEAA